MSKTIVEIETKTFIRFWLVIIGFFLAGLFLYAAREALALIGVSAVVAIAIRPLAMRVEKLIGKNTKSKSKLPSILAYLLVLLVLVAVVVVIGPVIVSEMSRFVSSLPAMLERADLSALDSFGEALRMPNLSESLISSLEDFSKSFLGSFGTSVVTGISTISGILGKAVIMLIMTLFFLLEGPGMLNELWDKLGAFRDPAKAKDHESKILTEARTIVSKMAWVVSTFVDKKVVVALLDGTVTATSIFILSLAFGVEARLAIPMGMVNFIFCLIPMFGQVIGGLLVTLILVFNGPLMALIWGLFYLFYAVIESNVFEPKIQGSALNLRPVVVLIAITIGTYVLGLFGTIIAIPIAGCVKVLIDELPRLRKLNSN